MRKTTESEPNLCCLAENHDHALRLDARRHDRHVGEILDVQTEERGIEVTLFVLKDVQERSARTPRARRLTRLRSVLLMSAVGLVFATSAAGAQRSTFVTRTVTEPAKPGLPVTGALSGYRATSTGRVVVPTAWRSLRAPGGGLRFQSANNSSCRYDVTYTVKSVLAPSQDPGAYVEAKLSSTGGRFVFDSGVRGTRAFRVVRQPGIGGRVRLAALWAGVLTRRADIAPAGQVAWTEIRVTAASRAGDECHSGTWRDALGPAIADSLAVARTALHLSLMATAVAALIACADPTHRWSTKPCASRTGAPQASSWCR
jgi:hypothetical protein